MKKKITWTTLELETSVQQNTPYRVKEDIFNTHNQQMIYVQNM